MRWGFPLATVATAVAAVFVLAQAVQSGDGPPSPSIGGPIVLQSADPAAGQTDPLASPQPAQTVGPSETGAPPPPQPSPAATGPTRVLVPVCPADDDDLDDDDDDDPDDDLDTNDCDDDDDDREDRRERARERGARS